MRQRQIQELDVRHREIDQEMRPPEKEVPLLDYLIDHPYLLACCREERE